MKTMKDLLESASEIERLETEFKKSVYEYSERCGNLKNECKELFKTCDFQDLGKLILLLIDTGLCEVADDILEEYLIRLCPQNKDFIYDELDEVGGAYAWIDKNIGGGWVYTDIEKEEICEFETISADYLKDLCKLSIINSMRRKQDENK